MEPRDRAIAEAVVHRSGHPGRRATASGSVRGARRSPATQRRRPDPQLPGATAYTPPAALRATSPARSARRTRIGRTHVPRLPFGVPERVVSLPHPPPHAPAVSDDLGLDSNIAEQ